MHMNDFLAANLRFLTRDEAEVQAKAAAAAGVGQPAISKIIAGRTKDPSYRTVLGLARYFGATVDDLVGRDLERDGPSLPSQSVGINTTKLTDLIETVEAAIADSRRAVPPRIKARLVARLYGDEMAAGASAEAIQTLLTSILVSLEEA